MKVGRISAKKSLAIVAVAAGTILVAAGLLFGVLHRPWYVHEVEEFIVYLDEHADPATLRSWAVAECARTGDRLWRCTTFDITRDELPASLHDLYGDGPVGAFANDEFATLVWGHGIGEWGLFIGPADWAGGESDRYRYVKAWVPGIHAFRIKKRTQDISFPVYSPPQEPNHEDSDDE